MSGPAPLRVFVVEDSRFVRERLVESLTVPGVIEVIGQAEGEAEAIAALRAASWNALVLDLELKQGSGFGVLKAIGRQRPPGTRVFVLTNYAVAPMRDASLTLGADVVFDKMRDARRLRDALAALADATPPHDGGSAAG
jgi:two-component system OmpR family response regulator